MNCLEPVSESLRDFFSEVKDNRCKISPCGIHTSFGYCSPCLCIYNDEDRGCCTPLGGKCTKDHGRGSDTLICCEGSDTQSSVTINDTVGVEHYLCFYMWTSLEEIPVTKRFFKPSIDPALVDYIVKTEKETIPTLYTYYCFFPCVTKKYDKDISRETMDKYHAEAARTQIDSHFVNNDKGVTDIVNNYLSLPSAPQRSTMA